MKYYEALAFYNEGMRLHQHEIAFQYFYKVLEHFFLVCRQDEFKNYIAEYNTNNNINRFIDAVTSVYKQGEEIQLKTLLVSIKTEILPLINQAFTDGVIAESTVEKFSDELYLYRNTIVHGKSDERFSIKIPSYIGASDEKFWTVAVNKIAEILIRKYCL